MVGLGDGDCLVSFGIDGGRGGLGRGDADRCGFDQDWALPHDEFRRLSFPDVVDFFDDCHAAIE